MGSQFRAYPASRKPILPVGGKQERVNTHGLSASLSDVFLPGPWAEKAIIATVSYAVCPCKAGRFSLWDGISLVRLFMNSIVTLPSSKRQVTVSWWGVSIKRQDISKVLSSVQAPRDMAPTNHRR